MPAAERAEVLADRLVEIEGLISADDIASVQADWGGTCEQMYKHARRRTKEIDRVARIHRDPFEPILPVLEAPSPVGEYRKITEEILRRLPDEELHPRSRCRGGQGLLAVAHRHAYWPAPEEPEGTSTLAGRGGMPTSELTYWRT